MMQAVREMQRTVKLPGGHVFDIGIGVNSGEMVVGNMGSQNRFSYTVMRDYALDAARLKAPQDVVFERLTRYSGA